MKRADSRPNWGLQTIAALGAMSVAAVNSNSSHSVFMLAKVRVIVRPPINFHLITEPAFALALHFSHMFAFDSKWTSSESGEWWALGKHQGQSFHYQRITVSESLPVSRVVATTTLLNRASSAWRSILLCSCVYTCSSVCVSLYQKKIYPGVPPINLIFVGILLSDCQRWSDSILKAHSRFITTVMNNILCSFIMSQGYKMRRVPLKKSRRVLTIFPVLRRVGAKICPILVLTFSVSQGQIQ